MGVVGRVVVDLLADRPAQKVLAAPGLGDVLRQLITPGHRVNVGVDAPDRHTLDRRGAVLRLRRRHRGLLAAGGACLPTVEVTRGGPRNLRNVIASQQSAAGGGATYVASNFHWIGERQFGGEYGTGAQTVHGVRLWWRQPDHYDWLSDYLKARGLIPVMRRMMFVLLMTIAVATALTLASPSGPRGTAQRTVAYLVITVIGAIALFYLMRWPTRVQSQLFSIAGIACIAAGALSEADPRTAMLGCAAFAGLAGYVAFFHSAPYLVLTLMTGLTTAVASAVRMAMAGDPPMALAKVLILCGGILAVPVCGQAIVHWLSIDSLKSSTDALTGLRNRRGFYRSAQELLNVGKGAALRFTVTMIDLDDFKRLNDTLGHATGDLVLAAVADSLREACPRGNTVIARVGGEEFLIAQISRDDDARETAERIRLAIASLSWEVTASLGLASAVIPAADPIRLTSIDSLIESADSAMYEAKRAGGNQIRQAGA